MKRHQIYSLISRYVIGIMGMTFTVIIIFGTVLDNKIFPTLAYAEDFASFNPCSFHSNDFAHVGLPRFTLETVGKDNPEFGSNYFPNTNINYVTCKYKRTDSNISTQNFLITKLFAGGRPVSLSKFQQEYERAHKRLGRIVDRFSNITVSRHKGKQIETSPLAPVGVKPHIYECQIYVGGILFDYDLGPGGSSGVVNGDPAICSLTKAFTRDYAMVS